MAFAVSRKVSCGMTVCLPAGAPGAPLGAAARADPPLRRAADLRAGALRRTGFFELFFFAMEILPPEWPRETTPAARRQRSSTIYRSQTRRLDSSSTEGVPGGLPPAGRPARDVNGKASGKRFRR